MLEFSAFSDTDVYVGVRKKPTSAAQFVFLKYPGYHNVPHGSLLRIFLSFSLNIDITQISKIVDHIPVVLE